jgi:hypothetical protein
MSLLGGHPKPSDGFRVVFDHHHTIGIDYSKGVLVWSISVLGATNQAIQR